eukprot:2648887-Pleurochrysis_carterae.AAC.3
MIWTSFTCDLGRQAAYARGQRAVNRDGVTGLSHWKRESWRRVANVESELGTMRWSWTNVRVKSEREGCNGGDASSQLRGREGARKSRNEERRARAELVS